MQIVPKVLTQGEITGSAFGVEKSLGKKDEKFSLKTFYFDFEIEF